VDKENVGAGVASALPGAAGPSHDAVLTFRPVSGPMPSAHLPPWPCCCSAGAGSGKGPAAGVEKRSGRSIGGGLAPLPSSQPAATGPPAARGASRLQLSKVRLGSRGWGVGDVGCVLMRLRLVVRRRRRGGGSLRSIGSPRCACVVLPDPHHPAYDLIGRMHDRTQVTAKPGAHPAQQPTRGGGSTTAGSLTSSSSGGGGGARGGLGGSAARLTPAAEKRPLKRPAGGAASQPSSSSSRRAAPPSPVIAPGPARARWEALVVGGGDGRCGLYLTLGASRVHAGRARWQGRGRQRRPSSAG
jgi:hypothetical protein